VDTLSYKTVSANASTVKKEWILIDAEGKSLGRVATTVAMILRGKHKPDFTPHVDCGDNVVIINAEKVRLTGKKFTDKKYVRHSGYPGGQKIETPADVIKKDPRRLIERAVKGMLPKNRLGRKLFHNMYVYVGTEHPHEAQKPRQIKLTDIK
jgi:large subunit ribosomal protein L13